MRHAARLRGRVQAYDWGSRTAIAALQRRPVPSDRPEAELWLGGHPRASAEVEVAPDTWRPLVDLMREASADLLGPELAAVWGDGFPFLLKILAAGRPLSVQAHPDRDRAREGFREEEAAGLALDAPTRLFADPHPKPELILALTPFRLLRGFRSQDDLDSLGRNLALPSLWTRRFVEPAAVGERPGAPLCRSWLDLSPSELARIVEALPPSSDDPTDPVTWVHRMVASHPGDPAVLAPLVLRFETLDEGEVAFTPPGVLHAYLEGTAVELMVSSDNVLRGGLTSKRVEKERLAEILRPEAAPQRADERREGEDRRWTFPSGELVLSDVALEVGRPLVRRAGSGPEILLCLEGDVEAHEGDRTTAFGSGEAMLVPATAGEVRCEGRARIVVAGPGPTLAD